MDFEMNRIWNQAIALVKANFQLLAVIAGVFLLVPGALFYVALPDFMLALQTTDDPEQVSAMLADMIGPLVIYGLIAVLLQMIGYMAMIALMGQNRPTVGEALRAAVSGLPSVLGATALLILLYLVAGLVLALVTALVGGILGALLGTGVATVLSILIVIAMFAAILYLATRFTLIVPAIVLEKMRNPVAAMKRSWALTRSHARKIFLFYVLLFICYFVLSIILGSIFGLVALALAAGTGTALLMGLANGLIGAAVAIVFSGILVSMHQQLADFGGEAIRETFE